VRSYELLALDDELQTRQSRVPSDLKRAWSRQPEFIPNLLDRCPRLTATPGFRLAASKQDTGPDWSRHSISEPLFNRVGDQALLVEVVYCRGRCGGFSLSHYAWDGRR
jgi:hypothetical protein